MSVSGLDSLGIGDREAREKREGSKSTGDMALMNDSQSPDVPQLHLPFQINKRISTSESANANANAGWASTYFNHTNASTERIVSRVTEGLS